MINTLGVYINHSDDIIKSLLSCLSEAIGLWPCLELNQRPLMRVARALRNRLVYSSQGARGTRPHSVVLSRLITTMTRGQPFRKEQSKAKQSFCSDFLNAF
jgi:hypothetical protein